jgi:hypothetical protein
METHTSVEIRSQVSQLVVDELTRYAQHGVPPGSFLRAVLENDLASAVGRADDHNAANLSAIVRYAHTALPPLCLGSPEAVRAWIVHHAERRTTRELFEKPS